MPPTVLAVPGAPASPQRRRALRRRLGAPVLGVIASLALIAGSASAAPPAYRGVTVHSLVDAQVSDMDRTLDAAKALGANTLRADVWWPELEPRDDQYAGSYLARLDRLVDGAHARGMKVLPILLWTPCWASSAPAELVATCSRASANYPPRSAATYADIASFVVRRYGTRLAGFQVWNEPNLDLFLTGDDPAADYTALLKATYPAVKAVARGTPVVAGALSGADRNFLERLYARGIKGSYDVLAIHPYSGSSAPEAWVGNPKGQFLGGIRSIRGAQVAAGDGKPLWLTEFGWNTRAVRKRNSWESGVDERTQARYLTRALQLLANPARRLGYVKGALVYELRDAGTNKFAWNDNWGLVRNDFREKPAFAAVKRAFTSSGRPRPRLRLKLSFRRARRGRRSCARSRVIARVGGRDRRAVRRVLFVLRRGRAARRLRLDRRAPFRRVVYRGRRSRPTTFRIRARVRIKNRRLVMLSKRFRACGRR